MTSNMRTKAILLLIFAVFAFVGCKSIEYVPVESVRTEYQDREIVKVQTDTINNTRIVWIKGDTIVDIRERIKTRVVEIHDTTEIVKVDSVRVPYPVEKELTKWQQIKMDFGGMAFGAIALVLIAFVLWLLVRRLK